MRAEKEPETSGFPTQGQIQVENENNIQAEFKVQWDPSSQHTTQGRGFAEEWDSCLDARGNAVPEVWYQQGFVREPRLPWALQMMPPSFLGARAMDCRCMEPIFPFGALLLALSPFSFSQSTLLRELLINPLLEEAGAAPRGDVAAMALGCYSIWSMYRAVLW